MASISIDLGPGSGSRLRWGVHPRDPDRLILCSRSPFGCLIVGFGLLAGAAAVMASICAERELGTMIGFFVLAVLGAIVTGSCVEVLDRRNRTYTRYHGLFLLVRLSHRSLSGFSKVVLEKKQRVTSAGSGRTSVTTVFVVRLQKQNEEEELQIDETSTWEAAVPTGEVLARFLRLPLHDLYQEEVRQSDQLDRPLAAHEAVTIPEPPAKPFCRVEERPDGVLHIRVPRPVRQAMPLVAMMIFVFVLWTIPVSLFGHLIFGLLPLLFIVPGWIKAALGHSADIEVTPDALTVTAHGLILGRRVTFPVAELEHIIIHTLESGGPREMLSSVFGQILVARSDRASVRFGYGLEKDELAWLRARILKVLQTDREALQRKAEAEEKIPVLASRWLLPAGFAAGAFLGNILGGPLGVSVALPFLEHVLNTGAVFGLLLGWALQELFATHPAPLGQTVRRGGLWVAAVFLLLHGYTPAVQRSPTFDEWAMLTHSVRVSEFWYGWLPVGAGLAALFGDVVVGLAGGMWRAVGWCRRKRLAAEPAPPPAAGPDASAPEEKKGKYDRVGAGCVLVFIAIFSLPCWVGAWEKWRDSSVGGAVGLLLLGLVFHLPWVIALNVERIRKWFSDKQWQLLGQLGMPWLALLPGMGIELLVAFDPEDESFPSGRWAAAIACGAFVAAGVAMMQVFAREVRKGTDPLLSRLAIVDVWLSSVVLAGLSLLCIASCVRGNEDAVPAAVVLSIFALISLYYTGTFRQGDGRDG